MPKQNRRASSRTQTRSSKSANSTLAHSPLVEARNSDIHGRGVYAVAPIKKGTRVLEYLGERISHGEADARYEMKGDDDGHTFLFIASNRTVIDAGVDGNDARFINHSCNPNCETVIENSRVFIDTIRAIKPGEELGYDYQLTWESTDDPTELALYACRCGAKKCRGTMLDKEPLDKREAEQKKAKAKSKSNAKSKAKPKTKSKPKTKTKTQVKTKTQAKSKAKTKKKSRR
ncbi:SET domain-containing protein [Steroidobacter sp.]|uniref:SET domain-containing protein n=1 Tax=Steroidobacter sp. TaxID=1978227 RepID=UPI001A3B795F|nr:SET domain-containing protein-lysine N-methyltransferase [Steroidobacter sp.]MBL8266710.1 SET domain-containing protein-lysine N-methyltransferase [Steroidobacter sp.]